MAVRYHVRVDTGNGAEPTFFHKDIRRLRVGDVVEHAGRAFLVAHDATLEPDGLRGAVVVRPNE